MRFLAASVLAIGAQLFAIPGAGAGDAPPIVHFHVVTDGSIYRGARPKSEGLVALAKMGVKTDLNLDDDTEVAGAEAQLAQSLGMRFESHPMSGFWSPHDDVVDAALAVLEDAANYPIYVHCQHGQDRTGVVVGLYRVFHDHWTPQAAYQEMLDIGFHPELFLLNHYFEQRTGFDD